jgi:predicted acyltransferase (DUF342 family)
LSVEHTRSDASKAADVSISISGNEDAVVVPNAEETENVEKTGVHLIRGEARIFGVFSGRNVSRGDEEKRREEYRKERVNNDPGHALIEG